MGHLSSLASEIGRALPFDPLAGEARVGVYGAGLVGRWTVKWLRQNGARVVACFDRDPAKWHSTIEGVEVLDPDSIASSRPDLLFVAARHAVIDVTNELKKLGIPTVSIDAFCATRFFGDFANVRDRVLADEKSKQTLDAILESMLTGSTAPCERVWERDQYFCLPGFCGKEKDVYVDAGAYVGDSLERFLWAQNGVFEEIYAFEPGHLQFEALQARTKRLCQEWAIDPGRIKLIQAGLSDRTADVSARSSNNQLQSLALGDDRSGGVQILRLDDVLCGGRLSFLKADVEGMELALIAGAADTIRRWTPKLAICVYHYPTDIPEIIRHLEALVPDYSFALRHHSPQLLETVLYCWKD